VNDSFAVATMLVCSTRVIRKEVQIRLIENCVVDQHVTVEGGEVAFVAEVPCRKKGI
jgi:hypothetical protein